MAPAADLPGSDQLRWVEAAELLRAGEALLLHMLGLLRGIDPEVPATASFTLSLLDATDVLTLRDEFVDLADQLRLATERLPADAVQFRWRDLQRQAAQALAAGTVDARRALVLARCMAVPTGFAALAEMLRCTDAHESWERMDVGQLLASFRDVDGPLAASLTAMARLSPEAPIAGLSRPQIVRLAGVLETYAVKAPRHPHDRGLDDGER